MLLYPLLCYTLYYAIILYLLLFLVLTFVVLVPFFIFLFNIAITTFLDELRTPESCVILHILK